MMVAILISSWLTAGVAGVILNVWSAPEGDPPYCNPYSDDPDQFLMTLAAAAGPFGLIAALLKCFSRAAATAKKEKRRVAEEVERDLAKARAEVEELLKTKRGA